MAKLRFIDAEDSEEEADKKKVQAKLNANK